MFVIQNECETRQRFCFYIHFSFFLLISYTNFKFFQVNFSSSLKSSVQFNVSVYVVSTKQKLFSIEAQSL